MKRKKLVVISAVVLALIPLGNGTVLGLDLLRAGAASASHPVFAFPISEPASLVLFGATLWGLASFRRRRPSERSA